MDQQNNRLEIDCTIGRDIKPQDLTRVVTVLTDWCRNCDGVLRNIEVQIANANSCREEHIKMKQQIETQVSHIKKTIKTTQDIDDPMSTDSVNSQSPNPSIEKSKRNLGKSKGLRGSNAKFWRKDN